MGKDPAVLLYTSDFLIGVSDMPFLDRGYYITLLCEQHQKGHLSAETICFLLGLGSVSEIPKVMKHFHIDDDGNYYNKRMDLEALKRSNYAESRRENGTKGGRPKGKHMQNHMDKHMGNHMENENDNENKDIDNPKITGKGIQGENPDKPKKKSFTPPTLDEVTAYCKERGNNVDPKKFFDYFTAAEWVDSRGNPVKNWKQKVITWETNERRTQGGQRTGNNQQSFGEDAAGDWNLDGITTL